ncbi:MULTISPECIES: adenine phosphoribosyltransferase [Psychrobacter]|uniref:adenine phosphoribosyltransferase n=1 Tax=Psychrobacter TaxID=497 RepID=UPI00191A522B|nr:MULTISPECIES: adenine phosphoribosyltransferase [Psychrobacter]
MSATASTTQANTSSVAANVLNTDHPFWQVIRTVPNFPKVGVDFYDITPLLRSHINEVVDALLAVLPAGLLDEVDCLGAVEARGFVFASLIAGRLGKGMILLRKPGKLPPPVANKAYALEYGKDTLEMQNNLPPERVLLVDDILATGGTLTTAYELCQSAAHTVVGALVLLDLVDLHGEFPVPVYTVLKA